ncbi:TauD/TfdA dioxygenase family protein [Streptomyces muensis]|uniref:TauD/TfdA family dioxygenase n=1 Tax=Streptomyces muensis TaxID=1077944 RepID=A0A9X1PX20_STRM4|nr:TauD/TfdA family dioxygenase [Streptomyces muensis]MCF1594967.1 TauD/TfdA family dioxygenase [Streptomyces muensis]
MTGLTEYGLGLRIDGFSPAGSGPGNLARPTVRALLREFGVLHFTGFPDDNDAYSAFAHWFGRPEPVFPAEHQVPGHAHMRLQTNVRGRGANAGGQYWHADGSFAEVPTSVTLLYCEEAPQDEGETLFADMRRAYLLLPDAVRESLPGLLGNYPCRQIAARDMERAVMMRTVTLSEEDRRRQLDHLYDFTRPLVAEDPETGRRALHLNQHWLSDVVGKPDSESRELLGLLYDTATAPSNVYRHRWTAGDLLVWDNASVMHKAVPAPRGQIKTTRRITIAGEK